MKAEPVPSHVQNAKELADTAGPPEGESRPSRILLIEDNSADVFIIRHILKEHKISATIDVVGDGDRAVRMLNDLDSGEATCPDLILLDLNLPKLSGHEVLARIRKTGRCQHIPVVVVTSSASPGDLAEIRKFESAEYFQKPGGLDAYMLLGEVVRRVLSRQ